MEDDSEHTQRDTRRKLASRQNCHCQNSSKLAGSATARIIHKSEQWEFWGSRIYTTDDSGLLSCYAVRTGNCVQTFRGIAVPSLQGHKSYVLLQLHHPEDGTGALHKTCIIIHHPTQCLNLQIISGRACTMITNQVRQSSDSLCLRSAFWKHLSKLTIQLKTWTNCSFSTANLHFDSLPQQVAKFTSVYEVQYR